MFKITNTIQQEGCLFKCAHHSGRYQMEPDPTTSDVQRLGYRQPPCPLIAIPLAVLGIFVLAPSCAVLVRHWPIEIAELPAGIVVGLVILAISAKFLICQRVVLDRASRQILKSSTLLFWRSTSIHPFAGLTSVGWKPKRSGGRLGTARYPVRLMGPEGKLQLFEEIDQEQARRATREIGEFLDLTQEHWDETLLAREAKTSSTDIVSTPLQRMGNLVGRRSMQLVFTSESRLVYAQRFETLLQVFGCVAGPMGLLFLFSPWLAISIQGTEAAPWAPPVIGTVFTIMALVFLLGRRGVTIDRNDGQVSTWWGIPIPIWISRNSLAAFSAVGFERVVDDPHGIVTRVFLTGDSGRRLTLFTGVDAAQIRPLGEEIADFLNYPIQNF